MSNAARCCKPGSQAHTKFKGEVPFVEGRGRRMHGVRHGVSSQFISGTTDVTGTLNLRGRRDGDAGDNTSIRGELMGRRARKGRALPSAGGRTVAPADTRV